MTSTTRYLSGAAYVDEKYAEAVVDELVAHSHRAVAPALGYDVPTVIRHCFRAQRLWLVQNALIFGILLAGVIVLPGATVAVYGACLLAHAVIAERPVGRRWPLWRIGVAVVAALFVLGCLALPILGMLRQFAQGGPNFGTPEMPYVSPEDGDSGAWRFLSGVLAVGLAVLIALTWSRYRMITSITTGLGRAEGHVRPEPRAVEQRLGVIDTAQHGNVVLHAGFEPFLGAGRRFRAWSIATELRPGGEREDGAAPETAETANPPRPGHVPVDPVELVGHLRRRLAAMRGHDLPERERVSGLQLRDQVIASGTRWRDYPLIDERVRLPFSYAGPEAVDAIIRSPQTSARHFLRATVGAPEKAATDAAGRTIMPAEHQSVVTSTYVHVAIEGGMLYVELVATLLGPIRQRYLAIDRYDGDADQFVTALREAVRRFAGGTAAAPVRLVRGMIRRHTLVGKIHRADADATAEPVYDFGARFDARQAAALRDCASYLQELDAEKYTRLIDKRATEAIVEFLAEKGVDTSDFTTKVNFYQSNNTMISGSVYGPVAVGTGASATVTAVKGSAR